jgi:hypothetical protein
MRGVGGLFHAVHEREDYRMGGSGFKRCKENASLGSVRTEDRTATAGAKLSFFSMAVHGDDELNTCALRSKGCTVQDVSRVSTRYVPVR